MATIRGVGLALLLCLLPLSWYAHADEPALLTRSLPGRTMDEATADLLRAIDTSDYGFLRQQAIDSRLVPPGWEAKSVRIVYFCNYAKMAYALDLDPRAAQIMPCRITLVETAAGVDLIAVNPLWQTAVLGNPALQRACGVLKRDYLAILEEASL